MDKLQQFQELAFGSRLKRLSDLFMKDAKRIYKHLNIDFEPSLMPVFKTIIDEKEISVGEIASMLEISQPAVTQFVNNLQKRKLLKIVLDKDDKRKKKITLSKKGIEIKERLEPIWKIIEEELKKMTNNTPVSFMEHIRLTEQKQKENSMYNRIINRLKETVEIIDFKNEFANDFYNLNVEWLEKYFYVEPYDKKVLSQPKEYIIDNNGYIFFATYNNKVVGTVALINQTDFYELSKMAVSPKYQGLKIGQKLMNHCIEFAKKQGWESITLYSHRSLVPAINLYKKVGFVEVELEKDSHYERSDIKMKMSL